MFILAYGAMTSYMIIIKDTVPTVLGLGDSFLEREMVMLVLALVTMLYVYDHLYYAHSHIMSAGLSV